MLQNVFQENHHKHPGSNRDAMAADMLRTAKTAFPHVSGMELVGAGMIGEGLPSTMVRYYHTRFRGGRAYKLKEAMRGPDDPIDPLHNFMWKPKTKHRPVLFQNAFPALTSGGGGRSSMGLMHPLLGDGSRSHNRKLHKDIGINKGRVGPSTPHLSQVFDRGSGYRALTDNLDIPNLRPDEDDVCPCHSPALEYAKDYIEGNHRPYHHDHLTERQILDHQSVQHRLRALRTGLIDPHQKLPQSVLV